jgi:hypothetical protein
LGTLTGWSLTRGGRDAAGKFNMKWGYDDCDAAGFARFDEEAERKRQAEILRNL